MVRAHIWLRKKDGMSTEEFRRYWLEEHAPIARDGYEHLRGYTVNVVTRAVPGDAEVPYDGVAELSWDDREGMKADLNGEAARRGNDDLANFTSAAGLLFVEQITVLEPSHRP